MPLWLLSMDLRKAFDTIDHNSLFQALQLHGISPNYIALLQLLYQDQLGSVHGSRLFSITRGVKQGSNSKDKYIR